MSKYRTRVKGLGSVHKIMPYLMNNRCDAEVYISEKIDVTHLMKYLDKKNKGLEKDDKTTIFHAFASGIAKVLIHRPLLNRFIQGKKHYLRNEISLSFVAKTKFTDEAQEMLIKLIIKENDNINEIKSFILNKVNKVRKQGTNSMDKTLEILTAGPRFVTSYLAWIIKRLDFYGLLPRSFTDMDPNYSTVLLTNLGSIKCNQVYHHLNNYGTNSIVLAIGTLHQEELIIDGKKQIRDIIEVGLTCDERIADGFYFAKSILLFKHIMMSPEILEEPLKNDPNYDI